MLTSSIFMRRVRTEQNLFYVLYQRELLTSSGISSPGKLTDSGMPESSSYSARNSWDSQCDWWVSIWNQTIYLDDVNFRGTAAHTTYLWSIYSGNHGYLDFLDLDVNDLWETPGIEINWQNGDDFEGKLIQWRKRLELSYKLVVSWANGGRDFLAYRQLVT